IESLNTKGSTAPPLAACAVAADAVDMKSSCASTTSPGLVRPAEGKISMVGSPEGRASRGILRREARMHDGAVARQHGRLDDLVVPFDGELLLLLVDERLEEIVEVLGVEARRGGGDAARHVEVADDLDAIDVRHLARLG